MDPLQQYEAQPCSLCGLLQASLLVCVQSVTALMQQANADAEQQPHRPLPALATTFATTQLQVLSGFILSLQSFLRSCYWLMQSIDPV